MSKRFKMGSVYPEAYEAMDALDQLVSSSKTDPWYRELIRIRASQINGCAYCVNAHTLDALGLQVPSGKIALIPVWREAGPAFSEQERAILQLTEAVTAIHLGGLNDEIYNTCLRLFGERLVAELLMAIITINAWNRIGVGLKLEPSVTWHQESQISDT